ncbi:TMEM1 family protein [Histoplasma capsulatum]|uniref:TMEM1 family protein n=1 Tax=Ajellomyces capsulatus TaxID=5037 RepID=A0A8A1M4S1_AJECA|nr:TMEM1 family protein [Histoplasma capsulatum]
MDANPRAGSNVTVEYTDPSGLFPSIGPLILETLPLRNLHWKSPTRPLRSIDSLHVDLVPVKSTHQEQRRPSDGASGSVPHRRHQIPGLRQTPYLKIYILSCDDNDIYKSTTRKAVREWIKTHGTPPQSSSSSATQDNHDAFEWLIIHVVSGHTEVADKSAAGSKWPGRGSTTVLEKIKADFGGSSKSSIDRVVQLRIPKAESDERPPELADQLEDLVAKLKSSILTSFDHRVSQYEEDIRLKDSQRNLPGWNFCTFFILKEGLARGFEHVGLYADALVGYDELAVGLDAALRDQSVAKGDQHGGTFLSCTNDVRAKAEKALGLVPSEADNDVSKNTDDSYEDESEGRDGNDYSTVIAVGEDLFPLDSHKKPYREMILANNISVFDFRAYIFSRQMMLLLKAARAPSLRDQTNEKLAKEAEDLTLLAEICDRASEFISVGSRTLRHDLYVGLDELEHDRDESSVTEVVNNIVYSWTYSAISQVLIQTATDSLDIPKASLRNTRDLVNASVLANFVTETRPGVPKRSSSLTANTLISSRPTSLDIMSPGLYSGAQPRAPLASLRSSVSAQLRTGQSELASARGDLFLYARRTLENIGQRCGWSKKWRDLGLLFDAQNEAAKGLKDVPLDGDGETQEFTTVDQEVTPVLRGIENPKLISSCRSEKQYNFMYEGLTDQIFRHYVAANRTRSAEMAMADIAVLRYRAGDYGTAASYFHQMAPFYASCHWGVLEGVMLELYGRCLKHLGRKDDYVRVLLKLLGNYAGVAQSGQKARSFRSKRMSSAAPSSFPPVARTLVSNYVNDLFETSQVLSADFSVPLNEFFSGIHISSTIHHFEDKDGILVELSLRFLLGNSIEVDSVKMRLVNSTGVHSSEIWLENLDLVVVKSTVSKIPLHAFVSVHGKYMVDCIEVRIRNITFVQQYGLPSSFPAGLQQPNADDSDDEAERPFVFCYPPARGLQAEVSPPYRINLSELRTIEIGLKSGWNDILKGALRVKPATAGLRLHIAEVSIVDGDLKLAGNAESGQIDFTSFGPNSSARLSIPYTIEDDQTTLSARLEVVYETADCQFSYFSATSIISTLPVSVNVQDIFKDDSLISRFTISPAMATPLRILNCKIPSSEVYEVQPSIHRGQVLDCFPRQSASVLYKIIPRGEKALEADASKRSLALTIDFTCLDEECLSVIENRFVQDIGASKFAQLARLLTPHLLEAFRREWTANDMEIISLIREIDILSYERVQWETVTNSLGGKLGKEVVSWLKEWHTQHTTLSLPNDSNMTATTTSSTTIPNRQIIIPVDVPNVQIVHTANLTIPKPDDLIQATVGEMIPATLTIRHTRRWCPVQAREPEASLEFSYEILVNPDVWLVGGRRRGNFTAKEGETRSFTVMLLPQRPGHLLLPGLDIKTYVTQALAADPELPSSVVQRRAVPCEVDYLNHAETVLVSPNLRKTTVKLDVSGGGGGGDGSGGGGGCWLVGSERRVGVIG